MTRETPGEDALDPEIGQLEDGLALSGRLRFRRGVPSWIAVIGCGVLVFWACLRLNDHQHPAAQSARRLWSLQASDRIAAIKELEGSGRVDTDVAIPALIKRCKTRMPRCVRPRPWLWSQPSPALAAKLAPRPRTFGLCLLP